MCPARQDKTISECLKNVCPPKLLLLGLYIYTGHTIKGIV